MTRAALLAAALLASTPAYAQDRDYRIHDPQEATRKAAMRTELVYVALSAADLIITVSCIKADTCEEASPIAVGHSTTKMILIKSALTAGHVAFTYRLAQNHPKAALRFAQFSVGLQGGVVGLNIKTLF